MNTFTSKGCCSFGGRERAKGIHNPWPMQKYHGAKSPRYVFQNIWVFCARAERWIYVKCIIVSMGRQFWKPSENTTRQCYHWSTPALHITNPEPHTVKILSGFSQEHGVNRNLLPNESNAVCDERDARETRNGVSEKLLIHARRNSQSPYQSKPLPRQSTPNNCSRNIFGSTIRKCKWNIQC